MSALTGVGPSMASGNHTYNGICADFPAAPAKSNRGNRRKHPTAGVEMAELLLDAEHVRRFEGHKEEQDGEHEPKVTDPVDNERFFASVRGTLACIPEANEQIRTQPHPFPADEHEQVIVGHDQDQHSPHKQVEVGKEPGIVLLVVHIPRGIDVNEQPHTRHYQHHGARQPVNQKTHLGTIGPRSDPRKHRHLVVRLCLTHEDNKRHQGDEKGHAYGSNTNLTNGLATIAPPKKPVQHCT